MTSPSHSTPASPEAGDRALAICGWSALGLLIAALVLFGADRRLGLLSSAGAPAAELAQHRQLDRVAAALGLSGQADTRSGELQQDPARLAALHRELADFVAAHPRSRRAFYYQALERLAARDYPGARLAANRALELEPRDLSAALALGVAHFEEKNYAEAERAFRWAVQIEPRSASAYDNLARTLWQMDRRGEALEIHRRRAAVEEAAAATASAGAPPTAAAPPQPPSR